MSAKMTVISADALIKTGPGELESLILTGGSDAATLTLYDNTSGSGTKICPTIKAATSATVVFAPREPLTFQTGCYAVVTGTSEEAGAQVV